MTSFFFLTSSCFSAINASTVEVKFNSAVDVATAETITSAVLPYAITEVGGANVDVKSAEVKSDGKTVVLVTNKIADNKDYSLVIKDMKFTADTTKTHNFVKGFKSVEDTVAPTIVSASSSTGSTGTNQVEVVMNEAIDVAGAKTPVFKVNGTIVAATQATDKRKFTLTLPSSVQSGTSLEIEATNVFDLAGNKGTATKTITVASDLVVPTITKIETVSDTKVKVTFDKAVINNFAGNVTVTANGMSDAYSSASLAGDGKSVELTLNAGTLYPNTVKTRDLTVTFKNLKDTNGNVSTVDAVKTISIEKDEVDPAIVGVTHKQNTTSNMSTLLIELDEKVTTTLANTNTFTATNSDGVLVTLTVSGTPALVDSKGAVVSGATESKYILVTLNALLDNDTYKITLPAAAFKDTATTANDNVATTKQVVVTDGAEATPVAAPIVNTAAYAAKVLTVTYDKAVNTSAINPANYKLNGVVLPADTGITLDSAKKVATITLPDGFVKKDITAPLLTVSNVEATDTGKLTTANVTISNGPIKETVAPVLTKAEYTDAKKITLTFTEATGIATGGLVEVYNGTTLVAKGTTAQKTSTLGESEQVITFTNEAGQDIEKLNQSTLTVKIAKDVVLDDNGNKIAATSMALTDKATTTAGTLGTTWVGGTTKEFTSKLTTSPAVEAGSTAHVYVAKDGATAIDKDNYTNFTAVSTQSASNLALPVGISFATTKDSYGLALADSTAYSVYIVVKDTSGNVKVVSSTGTTTTP